MKHCPNPECVHLAETGRAGEFRDEILKCSDCGTELAAGPPPEIEHHRPQWVKVELPPEPHAQRLAQAAFEAAGIPCVAQQAGKTGRMLAPGAPAVDLLVPEPLARRAALVLERTLNAPVELPDGDDLEFVDEDEQPIPAADEDLDDGRVTGEPDGEDASPESAAAECPQCGSDSITRTPSEEGRSRGFLGRLLRPARHWQCLSCGHRW